MSLVASASLSCIRLNTYVSHQTGYVSEDTTGLERLISNLSVNVISDIKESTKDTTQNAREFVLRKCNQTEPIPFSTCYPNTILQQNCHKIGEGVYGEVFLFRNATGSVSVMKIIPIEGTLIVNGERQKSFAEIISEIVITTELNELRYNKKNCTNNFVGVNDIKCVQGKYPDPLIELWQDYDDNHRSENDCPDIFIKEQLYVVLELTNGGKDLESYSFNNALETYSIFAQVACSLAVAEVALQFEHRDLHWGNILISSINATDKLMYNLNGRQIEIDSNGVQATVIDFTMSRITCNNMYIFNDIGQDPDLFNAEGDYQFEIYKLMQKSNGNDWQHFEPHSNVLWLHYLLDKLITLVKYRRIRSKIHKKYISKLQVLKKQIVEYKSVEEFVIHNFI